MWMMSIFLLLPVFLVVDVAKPHFKISVKEFIFFSSFCEQKANGIKLYQSTKGLVRNINALVYPLPVLLPLYEYMALAQVVRAGSIDGWLAGWLAAARTPSWQIYTLSHFRIRGKGCVVAMCW